MTKVLVTKDKLDTLAEIVGGKSDTEVPLTLDEMIIAADSITSGYIIPTLETVTKTYTPSTSAITDTITPSAGYDGIEEVGIIISAMPAGSRGVPYWIKSTSSTKYILQSTFPNVTAGYISSISPISTTLSLENKVVDPTESQQTVAPTSLEYYLNSVTINAIPSNYVGSDVTQRTSSDLTVSGATITVPTGYYSDTATKTISSGTEGTPTATKGSVSNHAISVTPSVTNTAGYIIGSTKTGTAVSVSASELVSGTKSIIANGTGIDVTNYESVDVAVTPTLETITKTYTPSTSAITETITPSSGYDGIGEVDVTVNAVATGRYGNWSDTHSKDSTYFNTRFSFPDFTAGYFSTAPSGNSLLILEDETVTPSTTSQIVTPRGNSYYLNSVTVEAMPSGTAGTPIATKGAVSNHAISVTPSVTNTTGYIIGGTKTGTAVSVSASELVSGSQTITNNDTYDVTNLASVTVNVSGGGGSGVAEDQVDTELESNSYTLTFTGLQGEPTSFVVMYDDGMSVPSSTPYRAISIVYDGTDVHAQTLTNTNNAQVSYDGSNFSQSYSNGTLTITSTGAEFISGWWVMSYTYGGTIGNINTADVQVGSGATSITFTGLEDEPLCWSCIFKSNFNTSNGYQRVIAVRKREQGDGTVNIYGFAMDSSAHGNSTSWSESYNNGSLTITSQGTNNGGYFHQPGYYQLTYVVADASPYEKKSATYRASTSAQTDKIEPSSGYDAMSEVNISIPAVTQTNLTADNIKSGTTVTISNGQSNLWSVTGTYSGGGGSSMNTQTVQSTSRRNSTSLGSITSLTCSKAGTYDIYWTCTRSNTSQTWGSQLYINNSAYGTENTTWSNNVQNNKLTGVTLSANQTVAVYGRSRNGYYIYAPQLTIVQTA